MVRKDDIGGENDGYNTKEYQYQDIASAKIREVSGVEKGKENAGYTNKYHFPTTKEDEGNTNKRG